MPVHLLAPFAQNPTPCSQTVEGCGDNSILLALIGVGLLLLPILFYVVWRNRRRQLTHMSRGDVVSGVAAPGPQGLLTAPHGGGPCVWWKVDAEEYYWTLKYQGGEWKQERHSRWIHTASHEPFALGGMLVHPADARVDGAERVAETTVEAPQPPPEAIGPGPGQVNSAVTETRYEVFALPAGRELHVLGAERGQGGALFRPETDKAKMVISTEPAQDFTAKIDSQRRWALGSLLVGVFVLWPVGIAFIAISAL